MILPGSTIGILGGGQLGRMTALAARRMGYRIVVFDPDPECPAGPVADTLLPADFSDATALARFAEQADVVTLEFENVPVETLRVLGRTRPVRPGPQVLEICQHREKEKLFLREHGFPCPEFRVVAGADEMLAAVRDLGCPCVAKTVAWGYDGKGQRLIRRPQDAESAWRDLGPAHVIVEQWVDFELELSVVCARNPAGQCVVFPPSENRHANHILDISIAPGNFPAVVAAEAGKLAQRLAETLGVEGLLAVELFLGRDGRLLVNEMAPRPHNSGHYTFDACVTSQFEQHTRAVCGLPLGAPDLLSPVVMVNLLGDLWAGGEPDWGALLGHPRARLHLYGKKEARPGRKMGHYCVLADSAAAALEEAERIRSSLGSDYFASQTTRNPTSL